jgi:hypothetical protein
MHLARTGIATPEVAGRFSLVSRTSDLSVLQARVNDAKYCHANTADTARISAG